MFHPSKTRAQRRRRRRVGAAVIVAAGLLSGAVLVAEPVAAAPVPAAEVVGLHKGDTGEAVRALQNALNHAGIGVKYGVDGYFGSATQASVRAFQRYKHLPITGVVDAATAAALGFTTATTTAPAAAPAGALAQGARGPKVAALQRALIKAGMPPTGGADGVFGPGTTAALTAFQRAKGLTASGVLDAATSTALGLGATAPVTPRATEPAAAAASPDASVLGLR